jgi:hypothetical protein
VAWHDAGWTGCVCNNPKANAACVVLKRIRDSKDEEREASVSGQSLKDLPEKEWPVCVAERGTFMAPFEFIRTVVHPYSETSERHKHIMPSPFRHPPYSAAALPFRWMLTENAWKIADELNLACDEENEPILNFKTDWVQEYHNQKSLLDAFFSAIDGRSLCFIYAKQTPLSEDNRPVLIGAGRVLHVGPPIEYNYSKRGELRCLIWERAVQHSIRPDSKDGFILPYQDILELADKDPSIDPEDYVAFAPEERRIEFQFATEHVTHDSAIAALLSLAAALRKMSKVLRDSFGNQLKWIDERLSELWKLRGPYPGLGAALCAFGIEHGTLLAHELSFSLHDNEDPWSYVDKAFADPSLLSETFRSNIGETVRAKWNKLPDERRALLKLLSRFEIHRDQAERFYVEEERIKARIKCKDSELLANPYLLYELDLFSDDPVSIETIDRGMFPHGIVREKFPLPEPSALNEAVDWRRVRALMVSILEEAARNGDTLLPEPTVIQRVRDLVVDPGCPVDRDLLNVVVSKLSPAITTTDFKDGGRGYQLARLARMGEIIRTAVERRFAGKRHIFVCDWRKLLNEELKTSGIKETVNEDEERARQEKSAALRELAESRLSVLVGPAGTGKTTLLSVLCNHPDIKREGVLLLAPTGKARVQMQVKTGIAAQTVAQFLRLHDRYDESTGIYRLSDQEKVDVGRTVIVDESSMLTEEQLGALIDSFKNVHRFILVGDSRQLAPIGAGRPFVDIVTRLTPTNIDTMFPRAGAGYAELTVRLRQIGEDREDLELADWFGGRQIDPGEDEVLDYVKRDKSTQHLRFVQWKSQDEILDRVLNVLIEELKLKDKSDANGFSLTLGGSQYGGYVYFNLSGAKAVENWQILSPVRGKAFGVRDLNSMIQKTFRAETMKLANDRWKRLIPHPIGPDRIIYGDKVINTVNNRRFRVYPRENALDYVANGEIGIVIGKFRKKDQKRTRYLPTYVAFSSQPGFSYTYTSRDFKEEEAARLELAYAITVHKAQGSEFNLCFLILPNPCRLLSRELLYTALTRQRDRIVVFHQGDMSEFNKYSSSYYSETARRLTNLFSAPKMVEIKGELFEDRLISRTRRGEPVRSKSEVIIADNLMSMGIEYAYEQKLVGSDGSVRYPDFTIENGDTGVTYYWEHLGMLTDRAYRERWERKLQWYRSQHILPYDEGGGEKGTLIITQDTEKHGINSDDIKRLIEKIFGSP